MDPYKKYKATATNLDQGIESLIAVFDEVIKLLHNASQCQQKQDFEGEYQNLNKSAKVFNLMRTGIDMENGGEISKKLDVFYATTARKIEEINMKNANFMEIENVVDTIRGVRDTLIKVARRDSDLSK